MLCTSFRVFSIELRHHACCGCCLLSASNYCLLLPRRSGISLWDYQVNGGIGSSGDIWYRWLYVAVSLRNWGPLYSPPCPRFLAIPPHTARCLLIPPSTADKLLLAQFSLDDVRCSSLRCRSAYRCSVAPFDSGMISGTHEVENQTFQITGLSALESLSPLCISGLRL